jgi:AcrR family transcriptional regulator
MRSKNTATDQDRRSFIEEARRAQIIECAIEAIAEMGYGQASLAQIAKRAGISTGVISYYFAGKDDLINEVVRHIYQAGEAYVRPRAQGKTSERDSLLAFIAANVEFIIAYPAYLTAMVDIVTSKRAARSEAPNPWSAETLRRAPLHGILQRGQADGVFRAFSVPTMADVIIEAIDLAAFRDIDKATYAQDLVDLFDHATRALNPPVTE